MMRLPPGLSYEGKLEHIIEQIVLSVIAPDTASADDFRPMVREFCKVVLRLNELEPASDAVIDEIAGEMIEWHAPRPDEPGWDPDLADASAEQRLMAFNRYRANIAAEERQREFAEREAEREQVARQDRFPRVREDAARRRSRGDNEGAEFLEKWIADQEQAQ